MRSFKDRSGRQWTVDITVLTVERVKAALGVDMPGLFGDRMQGLDALLGAPTTLVAVIYECCRTGAEKDGLTLDSLKAEWNGETADAALETWLEDLVGFFPDARKREALRSTLKTLREMESNLAEHGLGVMREHATPEAAAKMFEALRLKLLANESGKPSGNTPDTSGSTPAPSPSDSST